VCLTGGTRTKGSRFCRACRNDVDACKHCAFRNGWTHKFQEAAADESTFRALMLQYQVESPSRGCGNKRSFFDHERYFSSASGKTCEIQNHPSGLQANVNGTVSGRQQSLEPSRKRCWYFAGEDYPVRNTPVYLATLSQILVPYSEHLVPQGCGVRLFIAVSLSVVMLSGLVGNPWLPLKGSTVVW